MLRRPGGDDPPSQWPGTGYCGQRLVTAEVGGEAILEVPMALIGCRLRDLMILKEVTFDQTGTTTMFSRTTIEKSEAAFKQISAPLLTAIVFLFAWSGFVVAVYDDVRATTTGGLWPIPDMLAVLAFEEPNNSDIRTGAPCVRKSVV